MWLDPLAHALEHATAPVVFFFRDDDAGWEDDKLLRLLDVFAGRGAAIDLAVIPLALSEGLAARLRSRRAHAPELLGLHQHGYCHANHEQQGRKCEFGASRSRGEQLDDLRRGQSMLAAALHDVDPLFTPPWNRCTQATVDSLHTLGFRALSRDVTASRLDLAGLHELRVGIDWNKRSAEDPGRAALLADALAAGVLSGEPVGVMLHHAVMIDEDFAQLDALLALLRASPRASCRSMSEVLGLTSATH